MVYTSVHVYKNLSVHTRKSSLQFVTTYYNPFNIQFSLLDDEMQGPPKIRDGRSTLLTPNQSTPCVRAGL